MANRQLHAAVPPSSEAAIPIHAAAEEETTPLAAAADADAAAADADAAARARRRRSREEYLASLQRVILVPPKPFPWWQRLGLPFLGPDINSIAVGQPLLLQQIEMLEKSRRPGRFARLAFHRRVATDCLDVYNSSHPDKEYEPAPGEVKQHMHFDNGTCWIHGNFVARRRRKRRSACCSCTFLPAPRTLFFFETSTGSSGRDIVTCTPLLDEPVTESYSVWGFPLGRSERRSGKMDNICRTCSHRFCFPHPGVQRKPDCGHHNAIKVCEMCYHQSVVLHPRVFQFGSPDL